MRQQPSGELERLFEGLVVHLGSIPRVRRGSRRLYNGPAPAVSYPSMETVDRRGPRRVAAYFLAWTGIGLFYFTQDVGRNFLWHVPIPWWASLTSWLIGVNLAAALTPGILWLGRRFPFERRIWMRRTLLHLLFSGIFSLLQLTLDAAIISRLGLFSAIMKPSFAATLVVLLVLGFHSNIISYWTILGIQYAFHYYNQYQERRRRALQLELQSSEAQDPARAGAAHRAERAAPTAFPVQHPERHHGAGAPGKGGAGRGDARPPQRSPALRPR